MSEELQKGETKTKTENPHKKNQEKLFISLDKMILLLHLVGIWFAYLL